MLQVLGRKLRELVIKTVPFKEVPMFQCWWKQPYDLSFLLMSYVIGLSFPWLEYVNNYKEHPITSLNLFFFFEKKGTMIYIGSNYHINRRTEIFQR